MSATSSRDQDGFIPESNACRSSYTTTPNRKNSDNWQDGDIAFLRPYDEFPRAAYNALINTKYLHRKATNHPVISKHPPNPLNSLIKVQLLTFLVLEHSEDSRYHLVTTISAYNSGPDNKYQPPWRQSRHRNKDRYAFRAFEGSDRPDHQRGFLQLEEGGLLPKPKTSWVYTRNAYVVPSSILKKFDKFRGLPRMTQESLNDLLNHFREDYKFNNRWSDPRVIRMLQYESETLSRNSKSGIPSISIPFSIYPTRISNLGSNIISESISRTPLWSVIGGNAIAASS
ncbi:hypothetical protein F4814DRAFT_449613 [Daldinia grandis]|nr:hypothetical protein F4814DRAFT_449613 [Daldinia grandis]